MPREPLPPLDHDIEVSGPYGPYVKITCKPAAPPSCDLVVQVYRDGAWHDVARFNDMADDFAYTNAGARARLERAKIAEGERS